MGGWEEKKKEGWWLQCSGQGENENRGGRRATVHKPHRPRQGSQCFRKPLKIIGHHQGLSFTGENSKDQRGKYNFLKVVVKKWR